MSAEGEFMFEIRSSRQLVLFALAVGLSGCTGPELVVADHDSERGEYVLQCTYAVIEPSCRQKAEEVCPQGWTYSSTITDTDHRATSRQDRTAIVQRIVCDE